MSLLTLQLDKDYKNFLQDIKVRVKQAQLKAAVAVNRELLHFYWDIGYCIVEKQKTARWSDKLLDALASDLKKSFPDSQDFSKTNLKYMRMFAEAYPDFTIGQPVADQLNFYLSAIDEQLKQSQDNPTLGPLLCEKKDKVIAEYALRDINKPMGISEYQLAKALPEPLQTSLPTIEEIEAELSKNE